MADIDSKNKDTVDGFDFDGMDWGNEDAASASSSAPSSSTSSQADPFEASDDDAFGGDDSFYSLEQMPDTDSQQDAFSDLGGSDDFGDIKTDEEPVSYDFGSEAEELASGRKITDDAPTFEEAADPYDLNSYAAAPQDDEEVNPFEVPEGEGYGDEEDAQPASEKPKSKIATYLMAAAAAVIAVAGVAYVAPSFIGGAPQEVAQVQPAQDDAPPFPTALPAQNTALPEIKAPEVAQIAPPAVVTPVQPVPQVAPTLTLPELPQVAVQPPAVAEVAPTPVRDDPFKDLVGGKERGGIDAMKDNAPVATDAAPAPASVELAALASRLADLEGKVDRLADSFDNFVDTTVKPSAAAPVPAVAVKPSTSVDANGNFVPPMKPPIIDGVSLKGVAGEVAWLSSKAGVFEVKVGDAVPNGGDVTAFRKYRGDWIVVTSTGIIVRQ
ncbi:hypothetical protein G6L37_02490 [Agrobacterium rubi]|nr:hypothetical protein [Agrobacterium rubi]NTF24264.1 hypothetical protein [Agrobacterium rubi]